MSNPEKIPFHESSHAELGHPEKGFFPIAGKYLGIGTQKVILIAVNDNNTLHLVTEVGGPPLLIDTPNGREAPDVNWLRAKYIRGEARPMDAPNDPNTISAFADLFDPLATLEGKERARSLYNLSKRCLADGVSRQETAVRCWLDANYGVGPFDHDIDRPSPRTVIRAMTKILKGATIADLASPAGRKRNTSPYATATDAIIHRAAMEFWAIAKQQKRDAYERLKLLIDEANSRMQPGARLHKLLSKSAFYVRIDRLECATTVAAKYGKKEAEKRFGASGEPIIATFCFEYGYVDASRLENVIVFNENSRLPFLKPWVTAIMDVKSGAILACHVHAGDPRMETSMQTLLLSLTPPSEEVEPSIWAS